MGTPGRDTKREARALLITWVALIALTSGTFWLADAPAGSNSSAGTAGWLLGFAFLKSLLIASVFMEMRHGPRVWAVAMGGFLLFEAALLFAVLY